MINEQSDILLLEIKTIVGNWRQIRHNPLPKRKEDFVSFGKVTSFDGYLKQQKDSDH
jgi:hypothetical protein